MNILYFVKLLHLNSHLYKLFFTNLFAFVLIWESFVEENISLKFRLSFSGIFKFIRTFDRCQTFAIIAVYTFALSTISMHTHSMSEPCLKTDPAELVFALSACHVLASLVFFNAYVALGAWFAIEFNVVDISWVFLFFLDPTFILLAGSWNVTFLIAAKAETVPTFAIDVNIGTESAFFN